MERLPHDHPARTLAGLEAVFIATRWRCRHCAGKSQIVASAGPVGHAVEHSHEHDCPEHDDQLPATDQL